MPEEKSDVKSIVRVRFESNMALSYLNDAFDLQAGDIVFVEGKLEGQRGLVIEVARNFKVRLSDYKRVISKADTTVHGELFSAGSHFVSFDRDDLPYPQALSWYKAPADEADEYVTGNDDASFPLEDLSKFKVKPEIFDRGNDYYADNKVRYLCVDHGHGRAIVEGSKPYEVEFDLWEGEIRNLVCDCFCSYTCKHEVAAVLQLNETLKFIRDNYPHLYARSGYFSAVHMATLFSLCVSGKKEGRILFDPV